MLRFLLDPDRVTEQAFFTQEAFLRKLASGPTRDALQKYLRGRLGDAQATIAANRCRRNGCTKT